MASIPEEAKQVTFSVIDELTSEIVENVTKRLGNWMALQVRNVYTSSLSSHWTALVRNWYLNPVFLWLLTHWFLL